MEQVPLRQVLEIGSSKNGEYTVEFPKSVCYGIVTCGGIMMAAIHKAAVDFVAQEPRTAIHPDVLNMTVQFYRPTFHTPQKSIIQLTLRNTNKTATVLHFQLSQKKLCLEGHLTMTDFSSTRGLSAKMDWTLSPPPAPTSIASLESDRDPNWIGYLRPFARAPSRAAAAYMEYFLPREIESMSRADHWFRPAWKDDALPNGAVFTNELVHYLVDNAMPLWLDERQRLDHHRRAVASGLAQRKARADGTFDQLVEEDLDAPHSVASIAISTQIKKLLPPEGVKWLFMRATTLGIDHDRSDFNIVLMDEHGDVIASSQQVVRVIPLAAKEAKL